MDRSHVVMLKYSSYFFGNSFDEVKLMTHTFKGGVHPNYMKAPQVPISVVTPPPEVVIPMVQHIGAPCKPLVAKGDYVKMGQKIGENPAPVSAPVHASVSGKVVAVEPRPHPLGDMIMSVVIENDYLLVISSDLCVEQSVDLFYIYRFEAAEDFCTDRHIMPPVS